MPSANAYEYYQSQPLLPLEPKLSKNITSGRTYDHQVGNRVLPPKKKTYPFLDQLEYLLFPSMDFKKQHPGKRLERLELAVFGDKQKGTIVTRLTNLQQEVDAWQIANMQPLNSLNSENLGRDNPKLSRAYTNPERKDPMPHKQRMNSRLSRPKRNYQATYSPVPQGSYANAYVNNYSPRVKARDYDYENYRMVTPLLQSIGKKGVQALFD